MHGTDATQAHAAQPVTPAQQDPGIAAVQFALKADEGLLFLKLWLEGRWDVIRREWPDAPEAVFAPIPGQADTHGQHYEVRALEEALREIAGIRPGAASPRLRRAVSIAQGALATRAHSDS